MAFKNLKHLTNIKELENMGYKVLKPVPKLEKTCDIDNIHGTFCVIDLETTGLNYKTNEIIEIGIIECAFNSDSISFYQYYNELQQPIKTITNEITQITGITHDDVKDRQINWKKVANIIRDCSFVLCHNSGFDRKFLELQTPSYVKEVVEKRPFGCTQQDVDWLKRGFAAPKLELLNYHAGYWYDAHRALDDCWATLNLLTAKEFTGVFQEILNNIKLKNYKIFADGAKYEQRHTLKRNGYRWNADNRVWFKSVKGQTSKNQEIEFLKTDLGLRNPSIIKLTAKERYSSRG